MKTITYGKRNGRNSESVNADYFMSLSIYDRVKEFNSCPKKYLKVLAQMKDKACDTSAGYQKQADFSDVRVSTSRNRGSVTEEAAFKRLAADDPEFVSGEEEYYLSALILTEARYRWILGFCTDFDREVLKMRMDGLSNKDICIDLNCKESKVKRRINVFGQRIDDYLSNLTEYEKCIKPGVSILEYLKEKEEKTL